MKILISWEEVEKKYPDINEFLANIHKEQLNLFDMLDYLDEKYGIEGYDWECDPNRAGIEGCNPFSLRPQSYAIECEKRLDERLKKQLLCVDGTHHFKVISPDTYWCEYCGTLKVKQHTEDYILVGEEMLYPEMPHFLPVKKG